MPSMGDYEAFVRKLPQMALNLLGLKFSRFMLFIVNAGFFALATLLFAGAAIVDSFNKDVRIWIDTGCIVTTLSIVGLVMFLVAMFGNFVATKESAQLTKIYWVGRLVLLVLELNAVISIFIMQASFYTKVENNMIQTFGHPDRPRSMEWESLQTRYACCGVHGYKDWAALNLTTGLEYRKRPEEGYYYGRHPTTKPTDEVYPVLPYSCCSRVYFKHSKAYCEDIYMACFEKINQDYIGVGLNILGIIAAVATILEVCGVLLGFLYARNIRRLEEAEAVKDK